MTGNYDLKQIRRLLSEGFTAEELRRFCFDTPQFKAVYNRLNLQTGKDVIIDWLLEFAEPRGLIEELLDWAKKENPAAYEGHRPYDEPFIENSPRTSTPSDTKTSSIVQETIPLAFLKLKPNGFTYRITELVTLIGRAGDCHLEIPDHHDNVERYHATIFYGQDVFMIGDGSDKHSTKYGTFLNGVRIKSQTRLPLRSGDCIVLGGFRKKETHELARGACEIIFEIGL